MNAFTHGFVALKVQERLWQELGIRLPKKSLVWGSTRPDIVPNPLSHFKDEKIHLFYEKWDSLRRMDPMYQLNTFTLELGQIFHFLCDYFCYAHNDEKIVKEFWIHMKYEHQLHMFARQQEPEFFLVSNANYSMVSFRELVEVKHKQYLGESPSFESDLKWAFEMCVITARKLFENSAITPTYKIG